MNTLPPKPLSKWLHKNGNLYVVLCVANTAAQMPDEYPVTVVYQDRNDVIWARPLNRWHTSFTEVM